MSTYGQSSGLFVFTTCLMVLNAAPDWLFLHDFALAAICDIGGVGLSLWATSSISFLAQIEIRHLNSSGVIFLPLPKIPEAISFKSIFLL